MLVEPEKRLIALNVAVVAAEQELADRFCTAMSVLMDVPEQLPKEKGIKAPQTGGRVDPVKNTVNKVMQQVLCATMADPKWSFELYFTALTPATSERFQKAGLKSVRGVIDAFLMVSPQDVATTDPGMYMHRAMSTCAQRLTGLRKQLSRPK